MTNQIIDSFIGAGKADVAKALGDDVPGRVTAILLGLPEEDGDTYRDWTFAMAHLFFTDPAAAGAIVGEMYEYFNRVLEERKRNPGEDVLSLVIRSELDGEHLTDEELLGFFIVLLIGGIENTARLINNGLWRLAWDVELRRRLIAKPEMIPSAVDELLRYYTPAPVGRLVLEDFTVGGVAMKKDEIALTHLPIANRDPRQFPYPDALIPDRTPNRHIALGTGIHRCLGIHLLRVEAAAVFTEFLKRIPEFELDRDQPSTWSAGQVAGMAHVPVVFPVGQPIGA
jgi:cytochrome P450